MSEGNRDNTMPALNATYFYLKRNAFNLYLINEYTHVKRNMHN
jgi:hypothetical protein